MQRDRKTPDQKRNTAASPASSRTAERRQERVRERQRQRLIIGAILVVTVAVLIIFPLVLANTPSEAPIPPETLTRYDGLTMSRSTEGYPRLGSPDAAVQVTLYSSFGCAECQAFHDATIDALVQRVRDGSISLSYAPLVQRTTSTLANAQGAARAALCAGEQNHFWQFQDTLLSWQTPYGNQAYTNSRIVSGVQALGLNRSQYDGCVASGQPDSVMTVARQQANTLINFVDVPTITINGVVPVDSEGNPVRDPAEILVAIDNAVAAAVRRSQPPTPVAATAEPEATAEATAQAEATPPAEDAPVAEVTESAD